MSFVEQHAPVKRDRRFQLIAVMPIHADAVVRQLELDRELSGVPNDRFGHAGRTVGIGDVEHADGGDGPGSNARPLPAALVVEADGAGQRLAARISRVDRDHRDVAAPRAAAREHAVHSVVDVEQLPIQLNPCRQAVVVALLDLAAVEAERETLRQRVDTLDHLFSHHDRGAIGEAHIRQRNPQHGARGQVDIAADPEHLT